MKYFLINFFPTYKHFDKNIINKINESFQKKLVKGTKIFVKKKKTKGANMLVSNIEIFLKKEKKRSVNMVVKDMKNF